LADVDAVMNSNSVPSGFSDHPVFSLSCGAFIVQFFHVSFCGTRCVRSRHSFVVSLFQMCFITKWHFLYGRQRRNVS